MKRFRWPLWGLVVAGVSGTIGLALNVAVSANTSPSQRVMPAVANAGSYLALLPLLVVLYLIVGLFRGGRPTRGEGRERLKYLALYALTAIVSLGLAGALVVTRADFPLGPSLVDSAPSPDSSKTGYVYQSCFMSARVGIFVRQRGEVTLHRVESLTRPTCEEGLRVHWVGNGQPEVIDSYGQRLVSVDASPMHLNLGPH